MCDLEAMVAVVSQGLSPVREVFRPAGWLAQAPIAPVDVSEWWL